MFISPISSDIILILTEKGSISMNKIISLILILSVLFTSAFFVCASEQGESGESTLSSEAVSVIAVKYPDVYSCIVNGNDNVTVENTEKDGFPVIKAAVNPDGEFKGAVGLDNMGDRVRGLGVDLDVYKYLTLIYKYEGNVPENIKPTFYICSHEGEIQGGSIVNPKSVKNFSGGWKRAVFEIPDLSNKYLHPERIHILEHFHVNPFGRSVKVTSLPDTATAYVQGMMFHAENNIDAEISVPYVIGKGDGIFAPNETLTRAQSCVLACNILGAENADSYSSDTRFTDIKTDDWFYGYVAYCEDMGLLSAFGDTFSPDDSISYGDFADIILKTTFDATANADISGIGTLNSLPSKYITRAQAVSLINTVLGKNNVRLDSPVTSPFTDVTPDLWAYSDIMVAATSLTVIKNPENGMYEIAFKDTIPEDLDEEIYLLGEKKLSEVEELERQRIHEITYRESDVTVSGTSYYFSAYGNDSNSGKSPDMPKKSVSEIALLDLQPGDGVFFKSGETFRGTFSAKPGVTYSSYGGDIKPVITASPGNFTGESNWVETDTQNVWKLTTPIMHDVGIIVFDEGEAWTEKRIKGRDDFVTGDLSDLDKDLTMWHDVSVPTNEKGYVYLRSDEGNPGKRFHSIELAPRDHIIRAADDIVIDNLCLKYTGAHGVSSGNVKNLTVKNCIFEFIGGSWFRTDTLSRFGNAVEVYGSCDGYVVDNCYITQVYDAGVTHQLSASPDRQCIMKDVKYTNNVITDTSYPIEYFIAKPNEGVDHKYENFEISGNIIMRTGYGFGHQRPDKVAATAVKGWNTYNEAYNYTMTDNIFAVSRYYMMAVAAQLPEWSPVCDNNTYIHYYLGRFGSMRAGTSSTYDENILEFIKETSGDKNAKVYYLRNPGDGN